MSYGIRKCFKISRFIAGTPAAETPEVVIYKGLMFSIFSSFTNRNTSSTSLVATSDPSVLATKKRSACMVLSDRRPHDSKPIEPVNLL